MQENDLGKLRFKNFPGAGMPLTPLEKFAPLALVQIYMPSGSLGLGAPLNLQGAYPYNLASTHQLIYHKN